MTKKFSIFLAMVMVVGTLALAACGNGDKTTTQPTTTEPTTTQPTTKPTTTAQPTTTEPTTTEPTTTEPTTTEPTTTEPTTTEPTTGPGGGEPTAEDAPDIVSHIVGPGYDGLCWVCHMLGGTDPMPDDGYHEDYDMDTCLDCHKEG